MQVLNRPVKDGIRRYTYRTVRKDSEGKLWTGRWLTEPELDLIYPQMYHTYDVRRNVIRNIDTGANECYAYLLDGTAEPDPPSELFEGKSTPPNESFRKRQLNGEIVMSDAMNYSIRTRVVLGWKDFDSEGIPVGRVNMGVLLPGTDYTPPGSSLKYKLFHIEGEHYLDVSVQSVEFKRERVRREQTRPGPFHPRSLIAAAIEPIEIDKTIVTSVISDANKHHMDILTFAAEFPQTVASVISGFSMVARGMVALRKKEIHLSSSFENRKKRLQAMVARDLEALSKLKEAARNRKQIRQIEKRQQHLKRTLVRDIESALAEFLTAVASVWMIFRYEISTNLYAIQDALDVLANQYSDYQTSRDKDVFETQFQVYPGRQLEVETTHRVVLKQRFAADRDSASRMSSTMSMNVFTTLWELGKRTFVIDWFVNIGDFLTASLGYDSSIQRVCSYSRKYEVTQFVKYDETGSGIHITMKAWKREIINPANYLGLCFRPEFSLARLFDSVAMLWSPIKRSLINSRK